jgi:YtcA family
MKRIQRPEREERHVQILRRPMVLPAFVVSLSLVVGCGRAPSFNILGSFFPAWLICMIVGIGLAALVHWLLVRYKFDKEIQWTILVYPCLAAFFAFTLWLVFFS